MKCIIAQDASVRDHDQLGRVLHVRLQQGQPQSTFCNGWLRTQDSQGEKDYFLIKCLYKQINYMTLVYQSDLIKKKLICQVKF